MAAPETLTSTRHQELIPSGFESASQLPETAFVDGDILPWMADREAELTVAHVTLQGGGDFYLASAVGTHDKLVKAANALSGQQQQNVDNMLYARLPSFVRDGHASNIETLPSPSTGFPIRVMRNHGGQRLYFAQADMPMSNGNREQVFLRLGVCDKSSQALVLGVLSGLSARETRRRLS
jgi:hypothetical protein